MGSFDLNNELVDLEGLSDDEALEKGRILYEELFQVRGARGGLVTWKGEEVRFFADRFDHAFRTSSDRARHVYSKTQVSRARIERIRWIGLILAGKVNGTECRHVPNESQKWEPPKYLVLAWDYSYVIWLNGLRDGAWKFSSAYPTTVEDMKRYTRISKQVWKVEQKNAP